MSASHRRVPVICAGLFGLLAGAGLTLSLPLTAQPPPVAIHAPPAFKADSPVYRGLDANLYMQTAAEYRACCYQAYNLATARLKVNLAASNQDPSKSAVVMDLDETVIDNAGYQAMLLRSGLAHDDRLWDLWEEKYPQEVGLIPGAKDFIKAAEALKVTVVYISNRSETFRASTEKALARLEISPKDPKCLKLKTTTSDKTDRRKETETASAVLLYVGDNLRDFDERFVSPRSLAAVRTHRKRPPPQPTKCNNQNFWHHQNPW